MIRKPWPRWIARTDAFCARLNRPLLPLALGLAIVTLSGQLHPRAFAAVVDHLDWLSPPMDPKTGVLSEQFIMPVTDP